MISPNWEIHNSWLRNKDKQIEKPLGGLPSFPVAEKLGAKETPYLFGKSDSLNVREEN